MKRISAKRVKEQNQTKEGAYIGMKCVKCGCEIMEGAAFCPYCGQKAAAEKTKEDGPVYQADVKGMRKSGRLIVYHDRTEFAVSSVQKTIYDYSALAAVRKKTGVGTALGLGLDHIEFITEDGSIESCPVNRKDIHEAFLRIREAVNPYLAERKRRLLEQGVHYSLISSTGLTGIGILNISQDRAELRTKSGLSGSVSFQDVKSVNASAGTLNFSLIDGSLRSFGIDRELQDEILGFVRKAVEPYIVKRKEALMAQGIHFSCLSSSGSDTGTLNIFEDRAEFTSVAGRTRAVSFQDVRTVCLFTETLEFSLTDGTSKSFGVENDIRDEVLSFVRNAIKPYVLKRTEGFDISFGMDERIEINEMRSVFHILRQGGTVITQERPLTALVKCEKTECGAPKSAMGLLAGAAKAVGVQNKLGAPNADDIISYVGVELTVRTDEDMRTEIVRFGDFSLGMSRNNKKYDQYLAEVSRLMDYLESGCPECELIVPDPVEAEAVEAASGNDGEELRVVEQADSGGKEIISAGLADSDNDGLGIKKYIEGVTGFINSCSTPMTIAVQGSWGSGKSGIMKMLSDSLGERYAENRIWFNPRLLLQANSEDPLPMLMGKALIRQLSGAEGSASKDSAIKIAKGVIELLSGIIAPDSSAGQNLVEGLFRDGSSIPPEKLVDAFARLAAKRAEGQDGKVIILINELDKLAPAKAVELLEALRNFFDCEGCVFVAAIDYGFFRRGVKENPEMDLDENQQKALFDEIFQMTFRVPVSGQQIRNYVNDKLEHMGIHAKDKTELDFYAGLLLNSIGSEPKNMDRMFNSFLLLKNMAERELYENRVQRLMLFALLCMQARFPAVYNQLKRIKDQLTPELLSGLCGEDSEITDRSGLEEAEKPEFRTFARVLCDIIDTDNTTDISLSECGAFARILDFSSITSK